MKNKSVLLFVMFGIVALLVLSLSISAKTEVVQKVSTRKNSISHEHENTSVQNVTKNQSNIVPNFGKCVSSCEKLQTQCKKNATAEFTRCKNDFHSINLTQVSTVKSLRELLNGIKQNCTREQKNDTKLCNSLADQCKTTCLPLKCKSNFTLVGNDCVKNCLNDSECKGNQYCKILPTPLSFLNHTQKGLCLEKQKEKQLCLNEAGCGSGYTCNMKTCLKSPLCSGNSTCTEVCYGLCAKKKN